MTDNDGSRDAVVIERSFDAPVGLIWQMWTDPHHFKAWYGPNGATVPVAKMDVRVGGTRLVCMEMQTPDGAMQMWFTGEYREVVENQRLVYTESMSDEASRDDRGQCRTRGHQRPHQDGDDPCRHTRRVARCGWMGDRARQARRLRRGPQRPVAATYISRGLASIRSPATPTRWVRVAVGHQALGPERRRYRRGQPLGEI